MPKRFFLALFLVLILSLTACTTETNTATPTQIVEPTSVPVEEPEPTALPLPSGEPAILISEVLTGVDGNNNLEFIELTNTSTTAPLDLKGWGLWYQIDAGQDESLIYRWTEHALIPPLGHYLLVRTGQDVAVPPDVQVDMNLIPQKGGLQLRATDGTPLDSLVWGDGPADSCLAADHQWDCG